MEAWTPVIFIIFAVAAMVVIYLLTRSSVSYREGNERGQRTVLFESPRFNAGVTPQDIMENNWGSRDFGMAALGGVTASWLYVKASRAEQWEEFVNRARREAQMYSQRWMYFAKNGEQIVDITRRGICIFQKGENEKRIVMFDEIVQISSGADDVLVIAQINGVCKKALIFPMDGGNEEMTKVILAGVQENERKKMQQGKTPAAEEN